MLTPYRRMKRTPCLILWRVMTVEDWAEIRRLHRSEGMAIKAIARRLRISRNAVRRALAKDCPPQCSRPPKGSVVDAAEPRIRGLLAETPAMPATVIAGADRLPARVDRVEGPGADAAAVLLAAGSGLTGQL